METLVFTCVCAFNLVAYPSNSTDVRVCNPAWNHYQSFTSELITWLLTRLLCTKSDAHSLRGGAAATACGTEIECVSFWNCALALSYSTFASCVCKCVHMSECTCIFFCKWWSITLSAISLDAYKQQEHCVWRKWLHPLEDNTTSFLYCFSFPFSPLIHHYCAALVYCSGSQSGVWRLTGVLEVVPGVPSREGNNLFSP